MSVPEEDSTRQAQVQQAGLLLGVLIVPADGVEEILGQGQVVLRPVEVQTLVVEVVALHGEGVGHDGGAAGDELHGLTHLVFNAVVVRIAVIGVQGQHRAGQLVHHIMAGGGQNHVLGEPVGQSAVLRQDAGEALQLPPGGQRAQQQQIGGLLKTEAVLAHKAADQVLHIDAPVNQPAGHGGLLPVLDVVALDIADLGDSRQHAGAVGVAQPALYIEPLVKRWIDLVMFLKFAA